MTNLNAENNIPWYFINENFYPTTNLSSWIIRVVLSTRCNYSCPHCFQEWENINEHRDLSVDFIIKVIDFWRKHFWIHTVRLTWGEPLIYKDIDLLFKNLRKIWIKNIDITTNWYFLEEKLPILIKYWIKMITVSLDSIDSKTYIKTNGRWANLKKVLMWIEKAKRVGISISINLTAVDTLTIEDILNVVKYSWENWFVIRICEPTYIIWSKETKEKKIFKKTSEQLIKNSIKKIYSYCESVLYLKTKNNENITIMYNLCDNKFCNSCAKYLYIRLTSDKKLKPCLSRTDTEVNIWNDLSDENLHRAYCIAINNMWKWPNIKKWINLIRKS
jgi:cyclic pyranopterin phosphate synthase